MRRLSWRSVPTMCKPPAATTSPRSPLLVLGEGLLEAPLELLRRLVELLADLVDCAHVVLALGLVARVRIAERLLEGLLDGEVLLFRRVAGRHRLLVDRGRPAPA